MFILIIILLLSCVKVDACSSASSSSSISSSISSIISGGSSTATTYSSMYSTNKTLSSAGFVGCMAKINANQLASSSGNNSVKIWDLTTGSLIFTLSGHAYPIVSLLKLNDETLASGSADNTIKIWNVTNGGLIRTLTGHSSTVWSLVSLNDSTFLSGSIDTTLKVWSTSDWTVKKTITTAGQVRPMALVNSNQIAVGHNDYKIRVYDIDSGGLVMTLSGHWEYIACIISFNSSHLLSGGSDHTLRLWNINTGTLSATVYSYSKANTNSFVNLNNGHIAVGLQSIDYYGTGTNANNLFLLKTSDWTTAYLPGYSGLMNSVSSLILLDNGKWASGGSNMIMIWNQN